ncbi:major tail protein [Staphylococcus auricularis]|uniref:major tail protein n=1 Tax=Staphylococcus auricularis TaxID=29379 RepID=UPI0024305C08|nr:major tail protein [Staphylococcus auricularis]
MGKYKSATGLERFYYGVLDDNDKVKAVKVVDYLKEVSLEFDESLEKAYGSNKVAEIAKSNGETSLTATFHRLPIEAQQDLLGLVEHDTTDGVYGFGNSAGITYTACVFARTMEDGSKEWFGLGKGVFTRPEKSGQTKEDGVEFGEDEIEGEFMETYSKGFDEPLAVVMAYDERGKTEGRDAVFESVFGKSYNQVTSDLGNNSKQDDKLDNQLNQNTRRKLDQLANLDTDKYAEDLEGMDNQQYNEEVQDVSDAITNGFNKLDESQKAKIRDNFEKLKGLNTAFETIANQIK